MKPPNKMYFQFYGEDLLPGQSIDDLEEPADMENVTWCVDKIFNTDIEYVNKDDMVKKLLDTFSEYQIVAHDGRGCHGEHYFVREKELLRIIEESLSKELSK